MTLMQIAVMMLLTFLAVLGLVVLGRLVLFVVATYQSTRHKVREWRRITRRIKSALETHEKMRRRA